MAHPVKKIYAEGSPGFKRKEAGMTLTAIKKTMAKPQTEGRRALRAQGLLG